jgi:Biotin carboxylase, N-terminal domain
VIAGHRAPNNQRDFSRLAITGRGEPATRVIHAVRELNHARADPIHLIALHTETERDALFVRQADETACPEERRARACTPIVPRGRPVGPTRACLRPRRVREAPRPARIVLVGARSGRPETAERRGRDRATGENAAPGGFDHSRPRRGRSATGRPAGSDRTRGRDASAGRRSARRSVGSTRPVRDAARNAPATAARSIGPAGTHERGIIVQTAEVAARVDARQPPLDLGERRGQV